MSGAACSSSCGWCGRCSAWWEGPSTKLVRCHACGEDIRVEADAIGPYWCDACWQRTRPNAHTGQEMTR